MLKIDLKGKVALVTGGSRGIGGSITEMLSRSGAAVCFTHTGRPAREATLKNFVENIINAGGRAEPVKVDAADSAGTSDAVEGIIERYGKIDILACNAGRNSVSAPQELSDDDWRKNIDINLSSAFYAVRSVLPRMEEAGYGRIILIGSSAVYDGGGGSIDYASAKSGLNGMMMYLNREYARKGILTNVIHPCVIETDLLRERYKTQEDRNRMIAQIPAGRLGKPEDIAGLAVFLSSSYGDFICGQSILVDGGRTLWRGNG